MRGTYRLPTAAHQHAFDEQDNLRLQRLNSEDLQAVRRGELTEDQAKLRHVERELKLANDRLRRAELAQLAASVKGKGKGQAGFKGGADRGRADTSRPPADRFSSVPPPLHYDRPPSPSRGRADSARGRDRHGDQRCSRSPLGRRDRPFAGSAARGVSQTMRKRQEEINQQMKEMLEVERQGRANDPQATDQPRQETVEPERKSGPQDQQKAPSSSTTRAEVFSPPPRVVAPTALPTTKLFQPPEKKARQGADDRRRTRARPPDEGTRHN